MAVLLSRCGGSPAEVSSLSLRTHPRPGKMQRSSAGFRHSDRNGAIQPHLDQMQHAPINDPARHRLQLSFFSSLKTERVARKSIVPGMRPEQMCLTSSGAT